jgi:t-SNARE complex subunit (syntaxin)
VERDRREQDDERGRARKETRCHTDSEDALRGQRILSVIVVVMLMVVVVVVTVVVVRVREKQISDIA